MSDTNGPKRTGRPPKFPEEGARVQISVRLKPSTGNALREIAEKNNRSLAEEVEYRLIHSLSEDKFFEEKNSEKSTVMDRMRFEVELTHLTLEAKDLCSVVLRNEEKRHRLKLELFIASHRESFISRFKSTLGNRLGKYISFEKDLSMLKIEDLKKDIIQVENEIAVARRGVYELDRVMQGLESKYPNVKWTDIDIRLISKQLDVQGQALTFMLKDGKIPKQTV